MMSENKGIREKFETHYSEWEKVISESKIRFSSRPQDYTDNEPYRNIIKMGPDVLPFIMEKLELGVFLLNRAFIEISGIDNKEIISKNRPFPSEQEKSKLLVNWWKSQRINRAHGTVRE